MLIIASKKLSANEAILVASCWESVHSEINTLSSLPEKFATLHRVSLCVILKDYLYSLNYVIMTTEPLLSFIRVSLSTSLPPLSLSLSLSLYSCLRCPLWLSPHQSLMILFGSSDSVQSRVCSWMIQTYFLTWLIVYWYKSCNKTF